MRRNLTIVILASLVLCSFFSSDIIAKTLEKPTLQKTPLDQIVPSSPTPLTGDKGFCLIKSDSLTGSLWYNTAYEAGEGLALYMDPAKCGLPDPYPFKITDVHFYLYGWAPPNPAVWPVQIQVNIRDLIQGYKCNGPGTLLCSQTSTIPIDSGYPNMIHLNLDYFCCVHGPFFL